MSQVNKNVLKFVLSLKIRRLRQRRGLSLKDLAERSGLSHSYLNEIEKGKKYPKSDKLAGLAQSLDVTREELISPNMGKELHPLLEFLKSDLAQSLPLSAFGIGEQDIYDLMSHSPEKFTSFLMTISELAKSYDMTLEDLHKAALRAHLEYNNNYFSILEQIGSGVGTKLRERFEHLAPSELASRLEELLKADYNIDVDKLTLGTTLGTEGVRDFFKRGNRKSGQKLFLNRNLDDRQQVYSLMKEYCAQNLMSEDRAKERSGSKKQFGDYLWENQASYAAGAALIPERNFVTDLEEMFKKGFDKGFFKRLSERYKVPEELIMGRMTQVLPQHFGVNQLFFLCCNTNYKKSPNSYYISQELHLGQLHHPHGVALKEHYCRRWITVELLNREISSGDFEVGMQISEMEESGKYYLCLSLMKQKATSPDIKSCFTLGLAIDSNFKDRFPQLLKLDIESKVVGRTCERCSISDCEERVARPIILARKIEAQQKKAALENLEAL